MELIPILLISGVGLLTIIIIYLALTNRIIFKMAVRNFTRRKAQSVIVIAGLMIGTSLISASLIVQDTMTYGSEVGIYYSLGEIDEEIWGLNQYGTVVYFNESIYDTIENDLSTVREIEAVAPVIREAGSVFDTDTLLGEPRASMIGLDSQVMRSTVFGALDGNDYYLDDLEGNEVAVNSRLADEMDASVGDTILISYGAKNLTNPLVPDFKQTNLVIAKIIKETELFGKANYNQQKTLFLELDVLQGLLNRPNEINDIWISNKGDHVGGEEYTGQVNDDIQNALDDAVGITGSGFLEVHNVKEDNLVFARENGEAIGTIFIFLSLFSIIAGIVLIVNIFIMMGEERKSEMGMARAVGMKTKHLVRMYIFEGSLYAFIAAFIGALLGLAFGWTVIQAFSYAFGSAGEGFGDADFNLPFYFTWSSLFIAFCAGLLITFATIFAASTRIANLNIIRAIRGIPEPTTVRTKSRTHQAGAALVVVGVLFCLGGYTSNTDTGWLIGLPGLFIGAAMIAYKWISFRLAITVASLLIILVMIPPFDIPVVSAADSSESAFMISGLFLVLAGIFIVMFNSDLLLKALQRLLGWNKATRAVLKTAISYPMDSKMKTGMTLGMFALIIFVVTVIAMFASILDAQNEAVLDEQAGGYDIVGNTNPRTPFEGLSKETLPSELQDIDIEQLETLSSAYVEVLDYDQNKTELGFFGTPGLAEVEQYQLLGAGETFLSNNGFTLMERDDRYETDRDAWEGLNDDSSYCIIDGTSLAYVGDVMSSDAVGAYVGGTITITDFGGQNRTRVLTVIGVMDQMFFIQGIMVKKDVVRDEYGGVDSIMLLALGEGENTDSVAKAFEVSYLDLGLQTTDLIGTINAIISAFSNFMYLFEGFLGIGLLIGIAGIGIISYRNVIERRQQIGMLRAIGFKKSMIATSFLIETSFITLLAIFIGVVLGIGTGWQMYNDTYAESGGSFVIPWLSLIIISLIAYMATLIFTFYPSLKAARIPPAEALRYIE